jgi:hypothetical protein
VEQIAVLALGSDGKAHFFFFFFFFLMISACVLKACASDLIWLATNVSAVLAATRSAVTACRRIALAIFMEGQFPAAGVVPGSSPDRQQKSMITPNHWKWCRLRGLNSRPSVYKTAALPLS